MNVHYDVIIVGAGLAGMFCALQIAQKHKKNKALLVDFGRPPQKRRRFLEGAMGCLPSSDGKFYSQNLNVLESLVGKRNINKSNKYVSDYFVNNNISDLKVIKDKLPKKYIINKFKNLNFTVSSNDYYQLYPKDIHNLSRVVFPELENSGNIDFSFDNEVYNIKKNNNIFSLTTELGDFTCNKLLIASGRAGWMWSSDLYKEFNIVDNNDYAKIGFRIEMPANNLKDFNESHFSAYRDDLTIDKISWYGTVIPEDHYYFTTSEFRSNEKRWHSKNVSFSLIGNILVNGNGVDEADRLAKLTFLLTNDRVNKEKVSAFMNGKSKISVIKEYNWFKPKLEELQSAIPGLIDKSFFHVPNISPLPPKVILNKNLETKIEGLYLAGECAGVSGLLAASVMGTIVGNDICK